MCEIDLDYAAVWREAQRKARKPHTCDCCRSAIQPGEQYTSHVSVHEGYASSEAICTSCAIARAEFASAHGQSTNPSYFFELLRECVVDGDRSSSWRAPLAGILWRMRKAKRLKPEVRHAD